MYFGVNSLGEGVGCVRLLAGCAVRSDGRAGSVVHAHMVVGATEKVVTALTGLLARFHATFAGRGLGVGVRSSSADLVNGLLDTTDTLSSVNDLDLHVTLVTPNSSPGVSHDPVLNTVLRAVSDHTDSVIEFGSTGGRVHDTSLVSLEDGTVGFNEDGDGLLVKESLDSRCRVGSGHFVGGCLDTGASVVVSARSIFTNVGVAGLRHGEVLLVV